MNPTDPTTPTPQDRRAAAIENARRKALPSGYTVIVRDIDKDPARGVLGVRLTHAERVLSRALSIQIMDRSTVTVQHGFADAEATSFTGEDGEQLLKFMTGRGLIPSDLWDLLPEAPAGGVKPFHGTEERSLGSLIEMLSAEFPTVFGPHPLDGAPDLATGLKRVLHDLTRTDMAIHVRREVIYWLERMAHEGYTESNRLLKAGIRHSAHAQHGAAVALRERAAGLRAIIDEPAAPEAFSDAFDLVPDDLGYPSREQIAREYAAAADEGRDGGITPDVPPAALVAAGNRANAPRSVTLRFPSVKVGAVVRVTDPTHPRANQIGTINPTMAEPGCYSITFPDGQTFTNVKWTEIAEIGGGGPAVSTLRSDLETTLAILGEHVGACMLPLQAGDYETIKDIRARLALMAPGAGLR